MENEYKEVRFDQFCKTCKYEKLDEAKDPCNECLEDFMNLYSSKPVNWEEKEK